MIHQVTASEQNTKMLMQIVSLQLTLLSLAARETTEDGVLSNLQTELGTIYMEADQAKKVADWIAQKRNTLFGSSLLEFTAYNDVKAKKAFVEDVRYDVELVNSPRQARLRVAISANSPSWHIAAKDFLLEFYGIFGKVSGFPAYLFQPEAHHSKFRRWDFIDNFTDANPNLRLCAVCDSTLYRTTFVDRPYASIEHFFPKSRYPHLAVHPLNLIPICPHCNSGAAGATDPFGEDEEDELGMLGMILPYQNDQAHKGLSEQTYVHVSRLINRDQHPFQLEMYPNKHFPDAKALITSFERIYKVQERWNQDIDWIDQHVFRRITQFLMVDVQSGNRLENVSFMVERLNILMAMVSKENLGRDPFGFATIWLLKHHIDALHNSLTDANAEPIYAALKDWAKREQGRWDDYRAHAAELISRVPQQLDP